MVTGKRQVIRNTVIQVSNMKNRTRAGMWRAVFLVKGQALRMTPVATGHLRGSCDTDVISTSNKVTGMIWYSATYAIWVHEINKNYRAPGTSWKYLERALAENSRQVMKILEDTARIR